MLLFSVLTDCLLMKFLTSSYVDPLTSRSRVLPASKPELAALSLHEMTPSVVESEVGNYYTQSSQKDRLDRVAMRVLNAGAAATPDYQLFNWSVFLREEESVNAFSMPNGVLAFNYPLVKRASDDELACVVGHEMTHTLMFHNTEQNFARIFIGDFLDDARCIFTGRACALDSFYADGLITNYRQLLLDGAISQAAEFEADVYGMYFATLAGYDPAGCVRTFEPGGLLSDSASSSKKAQPAVSRVWNDMSSSHPSHADRAQRLRGWLRDGSRLKLRHLEKSAATGSLRHASPLALRSLSEGSSGGQFHWRLFVLVGFHAAAVAAAVLILVTSVSKLQEHAERAPGFAEYQQLAASLGFAVSLAPTMFTLVFPVLDKADDHLPPTVVSVVKAAVYVGVCVPCLRVVRDLARLLQKQVQVFSNAS